MDLGATVCARKPRCERCPIASECIALKEGRIHELPPPRARRELPQREVTWLVLRRNGAVLVERRPSPGIWGGLWCFPELKGKRPPGGRAMQPIEHGFTHFRLRIRPVLWAGDRAASPSSGRWLPLEEAGAAALPAQGKTLLARLREAGH